VYRVDGICRQPPRYPRLRAPLPDAGLAPLAVGFSGAVPALAEGWSPITDFSGHTLKIGQRRQPAASATGHRVSAMAAAPAG
jgi:hypothetical protein